MLLEVVITLVCALATWRIGHILSYEEGPLDSVKTVRDWLNKDWSPWIRFWGELMSCIYCNSVWVGCAIGYLWAVHLCQEPHWVWAILGGLSFSAVTLILDYFLP